MKDWQTVITFTQPHEAHIAKGVLESEGIETIVQNEFTVQINNFYSNAIGGVKILINNDNYEKGVQILKKGGYIIADHNNDKLSINSCVVGSKSDLGKCPYCNSENFSKSTQPRLISIAGVFFFNGIFPLFKRHYYCFDCNERWIFKLKHN